MYDKVKSESKVDVPKLMGNVEPNVFVYFIFALLAKLQETLKTVKMCRVVFWKRSSFISQERRVIQRALLNVNFHKTGNILMIHE